MLTSRGLAGCALAPRVVVSSRFVDGPISPTQAESTFMTSRLVRNTLVVSLALTAACSSGTRTASIPAAPLPAAPSITDGRSLLGVMRAKYDTSWYKTLSFTQNNTLYSSRGTTTNSQWRQRIAVPGKLRIDYLPVTSRSGVLFDGTRVHTFDNGRAIDARPGINTQLLLTADVYALPLDRSAHVLDSLGFDLTKLRRDTWEGQGAYVVGAAAGDSTTSQFWIDTTRMVPLRIVQNQRLGSRDIVTDVRYGKFTELGGLPIATEVVQYRDGRLVFREQRVDVRVNETIPDATFDASKWK
jgi:hypothetical protein